MGAILDGLKNQLGASVVIVLLSTVGACGMTWLNVRDLQGQVVSQQVQIQANTEARQALTATVIELRLQTAKLTQAVEALTAEVQNLRNDIRSK
jgi:hypothetical protein